MVRPGKDTRPRSPLQAVQVKDFARSLGADVVGLIDTATLNANPPDPTAPQTPDRIYPEARSCVIIGKRMPLGEFLSENRWAVAYANAAICRYLERLAYRLTFWLEEQGHNSVQVIMDETDPDLKRGSYGYLSYRHVAVEAGLGTFGLEANLLNPEFGPRLYFNAVLTDAELAPDRRIVEQLCIGPTCGRCLLACPTDAVHQWTLDKRLCGLAAQVHGVSSILKGPVRELLRDPRNVEAVLDDPQTRGKWNAIVGVAEAFGVCPRCIAVCPVGGDYQRYLAKAHRYIPETTPEKQQRVAEMVRADKGGTIVANNPQVNVRFIGPIGYQRLRRADGPEIERAQT